MAKVNAATTPSVSLSFGRLYEELELLRDAAGQLYGGYETDLPLDAMVAMAGDISGRAARIEAALDGINGALQQL